MSRKNLEELSEQEILSKIMEKKEFSKLPYLDVKKVYDFFCGEKVILERIKLTRDLLRKMYTAFLSNKLLSLKDKDYVWFLQKHKSTFERLEFYEKIYSRILKNHKITIFDLGCGINGFSFSFFEKLNLNVKYFGLEAVGQLVDLQNNYFKTEKKDGKVFHESLFDAKRVKEILRKGSGEKIIFLFKTLDSLEMIEKDYSKKFLMGVAPLVDKIVVSFATSSLIKKRKFHANRKWLTDFIEENFEIVDHFEEGNERYIVFK
jgi:hypothetical protein